MASRSLADRASIFYAAINRDTLITSDLSFCNDPGLERIGIFFDYLNQGGIKIDEEKIKNPDFINDVLRIEVYLIGIA